MQLNPCLRLQSTRSPQHLGIQLAQERSLTQSDKCVDSAVARAGRCCPVWSRSPTCIRFPGAWCGTCTQPSALTAESRVVTCCVLIMHIWGFGGSNYPGRSANVWGRCMYLALYQFMHRRAEMQHRLRICCCPAILQNCTRSYLAQLSYLLHWHPLAHTLRAVAVLQPQQHIPQGAELWGMHCRVRV